MENQNGTIKREDNGWFKPIDYGSLHAKYDTQIKELICNGLSNKEINEKLCLNLSQKQLICLITPLTKECPISRKGTVTALRFKNELDALASQHGDRIKELILSGYDANEINTQLNLNFNRKKILKLVNAVGDKHGINSQERKKLFFAKKSKEAKGNRSLSENITNSKFEPWFNLNNQKLKQLLADGIRYDDIISRIKMPYNSRSRNHECLRLAAIKLGVYGERTEKRLESYKEQCRENASYALSKRNEQDAEFTKEDVDFARDLLIKYKKNELPETRKHFDAEMLKRGVRESGRDLILQILKNEGTEFTSRPDSVRFVSGYTNGINYGIRGTYWHSDVGIGFDSLMELWFIRTTVQNGGAIKRVDFSIPYLTKDNKNKSYVPDFIVDDRIIVEIKAYRAINGAVSIFLRSNITEKLEALKKYCERNNLQWKLVTNKECDPYTKEASIEMKRLYDEKAITFASQEHEQFFLQTRGNYGI